MANKRYLVAADFPLEYDENTGFPKCRVCKTVLPKASRRICSTACRQTYEILTNPSYARALVERRDKGVCARCKIDTQKLRRVYFVLVKRAFFRLYKDKNYYFTEQVAKSVSGYIFKHSPLLQNFIEKYQWFDYNRHSWECDHVHPVYKGGLGTLDNLQTLCVPCHKQKTKEDLQHARQQRNTTS